MNEAKAKPKLMGGCACGALRYELTDTPMFTHCCHCRQCQRLTGSAFVLNTIIENDCINILSGNVHLTKGPTEYDSPHDIYRCDSCQTPLWSDYGGRPNYRFVRVGTLDEPNTITPDVHIFTRSKVDWVTIPENHRVFDVYYDTKEEWPADMLERRRAALKG